MNTDLVKLVLISLGGGGWLLYKGFQAQRRRQQILDTPRSKLNSAAQGLVEVHGFAWPKTTTTRTIKNEEAIFYSFQLQREETQGSGKNKRKVWVTVFSSGLASDFFVLDPSGLAVLDPTQAQLELEERPARLWRSLNKDERQRVREEMVTEAVSRFPPGDGLMGLFSANFRVLERAILVGSPLLVCGEFRSDLLREKSAQSHGLTAFARRVIDPKTRGLKKLDRLLDKNGDGVVSEKEARDGYVEAAVVSRRAQNVEEAEYPIHGAFYKSPVHTLTVSDCHEEALIRRLQWKMVWQLSLGSTLASVGVFVALAGQFPQWKDLKGPANRQPSQLNAQQLHASCVGNDLNACHQLISQAKALNLSQQQLDYYSSKLKR